MRFDHTSVPSSPNSSLFMTTKLSKIVSAWRMLFWNVIISITDSPKTPDHRHVDAESKWCHQHNVASPISGIFWVFCTVERSGDVPSIFLYLSTLNNLSVSYQRENLKCKTNATNYPHLLACNSNLFVLVVLAWDQSCYLVNRKINTVLLIVRWYIIWLVKVELVPGKVTSTPNSAIQPSDIKTLKVYVFHSTLT